MNLRPFERRKAFFLSQIVFAVASSLFCVWMITYPALKAVFENKPLPNEWTWSAIILFDLVFLILCVGLCTEPCIQLLTEFTEEGILQLSFPSSKFIRWQDIQRVSVKANHIQISGLFEFKEFEKLKCFTLHFPVQQCALLPGNNSIQLPGKKKYRDPRCHI